MQGCSAIVGWDVQINFLIFSEHGRPQCQHRDSKHDVQDTILSAAQLKSTTWVPTTMQPLAVDHEAFGTPQDQISPLPLCHAEALQRVEAWRNKPGKKCPLNLHATWIPAHKRFSRATLNPSLATPNKMLEKTTGYSIAVCTSLLLHGQFLQICVSWHKD